MERNNIICAVQVVDAEVTEEIWKGSLFFNGSCTFYEFMTRPSAQREEFIGMLKQSHEFSGNCAITRI